MKIVFISYFSQYPLISYIWSEIKLRTVSWLQLWLQLKLTGGCRIIASALSLEAEEQFEQSITAYRSAIGKHRSVSVSALWTFGSDYGEKCGSGSELGIKMWIRITSLRIWQYSLFKSFKKTSKIKNILYFCC